MNALATVVCVYGLFENSPAVVIGAMMIAMLLGPIAGVSLGLVDRNNPLLRKSLKRLAGLRNCLRNGVPIGRNAAPVSFDW